MILSGKVWKFGDNVGATDLISAKHDKLGMSHQWAECAKHVLEDIDPGLVEALARGDLLVAGESFGVGHAHYYQAAVMGSKTAGFGGFFAESISGLFQRAAIDFGMPAWVIKGISGLVEQGDRLEIDLRGGVATNRTSGATLAFPPVSPIILDILEADGSQNWALRRVGAAHAA